MKTVGVIGGLGPMATVYFLELLTTMKKAACDQEHLTVYTASIPSTPDRTAYILGQSKDSPLPYLLSAGEKLISAGAELLAIPCVTAQYFQEDLQSQLKVPVISLCREVALRLKEQKAESAALLATSGTLESRLLQRELERLGIAVLCPQRSEQDKIMDIIYGQIKKGKKPDIEGFKVIGRKLHEQGADRVVLGCTELSLLKRDFSLEDYYLDVLDVLAAKTIEMSA